MQKADPLVRTKLHPPFTRPELVPRPRLQEQIAQGLHGPLTLITAPAGFGKTSLVASCIAGSGMPVAWLSLDKNDNQTGRFLNYLVASIQEADHTIGSEAAQLLAASQPAPLETVLTSLINGLDISGGEIILVLDDYQFISSQAVHEAVAFLLEHHPSTFHLVIATRSDPPLPIARLRARGQVVELRAVDLRFTAPEAAQFLNDVMGIHLDAGSVAALEERTEGWIAGLQMAALSMKDRDDVLAFIAGFSGTHRYILDYLLEEVLANQPPEVQRFLLCSSILERLTAPLCDAVTEIREWSVERSNESRPSSLDSRSILEFLERANLFLVPLDDKRIWYRYHHLFADLLRARLDQIYPGLSPRLHARAANWLEQAGMMVEAINHALAAGAYDHAASLVEENTTHLLAQGELNALMGWIETLPAELRLARPWLCVHQAYALAFAGRLAEVGPLLQQAEASIEADTLAGKRDETDTSSATTAKEQPGAEVQVLRGAVSAIRAMTAVMTGQDVEALSQAQQARELLPAGNLWDQAAAAWALGYALRSLGYMPEARTAFEEQILLGRAMGNIWTLVTGLTDLAQVLRTQGQLRQARALLEEALASASQQGARSLGYIARMEASLASALYEQNELEAAHHLLADAVAHARQWPNPNHLAYAYTLQARVLLAQGDLQGAWVSIGEANWVRKSAKLTRILRRMVEADLVRVWLALQEANVRLDPGDPLADQPGALVAAWRSERLHAYAGSEDRIDECAEMAALTLVRVALAAGRAEEALSILERVTQSTRAANHIDGEINSLILIAITRLGKPTSRSVSALTALEEALSLAEPGGYVRVFLDEGRPMQMLLAQWLAHSGASPLRNYAIHLLSQFEIEQHMITATQEKVSPAGDRSVRSGQALVEPLSQRELEVLHLIALGKTNLEIARQLIVSRGTIKAHAASIYRKLDVSNRTEAVARARQLGILP
jgi:LuxR family maltose regulon positive regulatory protein